MLKIITFDPGDHTGWVSRDENGVLSGGTIFTGKHIWEDITSLNALIQVKKPDVIVYETFNLYPGAAAHLVHNEFYPCQMIGVIKTLAHMHHIHYVVPQAPSVKRYSGGLDDRWKMLRNVLGVETSEHTKDSYLHLRYYEMFNEKRIEKFRISYQ